MRKVLLALALTAVGLGLLLSFKSRPAAAGTSALGGSALSGVGTSTTSTTSTTGTSGTNATAPSPSPTGSATASGSATGSTSGSGSGSGSGAKTGAAAKGGSAVKNGTFTGAAENTEYGPVQVQAVVSGGRLTDVAVLQVPDRGGYESQIVQVALPQLKSEALSAQTANIDIVSGATYTSQGYAQSLQSALDLAGL